MSEEDLVKGIGSMAGDSSPAGGDASAGAPADDVSQAELVRQFGGGVVAYANYASFADGVRPFALLV